MKVSERNATRSPNDKNVKDQGFEKKRFVLTQDDLIYYDKKDDKNVSCIPLLCIEDIYVHDMKKDKGQNTCFYVNTSSEIYTIKCNSDLDWDLWIKSLIHSTNLAKESFIIKDINKKIELNQTFLFEISSKNSICDTNFVFADRRQLDRAFSIFEKYPESFLPKVNNAAEVVPLLKSLTVNFLEAKRLKSDPSALQTFQNKVTACIAILHNPMMEDLHSQGFVASTLADEQLPGEEDHTGVQHTFEENFDRLAKIIDDLFYNLQRLSVSNNIFLEEYYSRLENANLKQCEGIIV